jgi:CcmD family protein
MMKKILLSVFSIFLSIVLFAQDTAAVHADDREATGLRADGKMYVVLAVAVTILVGLFVYLIRLDRKLTRLEKGGKD